MNYSTIDLNIENYDDSDLEGFFNLDKTYGEHDVVTKDASIRDKILNTITDKSFQTQLFIFLDEAKRLLIQRLKRNPLFDGDGSNFVIDKPQESIMNYIQFIDFILILSRCN